ncbi:MAG: tetratricopeptide repeat protein [bacterium]|nr:tetratricopeptide repeat protein [bacterium]
MVYLIFKKGDAMLDAKYYYNEGIKKGMADPRGAMENFTRSVEFDPSYTDAYMKRGMVRYRVLKMYQEALEDFNQAVYSAPQERADAYLHRGIVKCHLLQFTEALEDLDRAIQLDPFNEEAYFNRGKNKFVLKQSKEEITQDLETAVNLGSAKAADMLKMFFGENRDAVEESLEKGIHERAEQLK